MAKDIKKEETDLKTNQEVMYDTKGIDYFARVKIKVLEGARYHKPGSIIEGSETLLRKMESEGTGELYKGK